jgi:hypothetical protein
MHQPTKGKRRTAGGHLQLLYKSLQQAAKKYSLYNKQDLRIPFAVGFLFVEPAPHLFLAQH